MTVYQMAAASVSAHDAYGVPVWVLSLGALGSVAIFQLLGKALWDAGWKENSGIAIHRTADCEAHLPPLMALFFQQVLGMGSAMLLLLGLAIVGLFHLSGIFVMCVLVVVAVVFGWRVQKHHSEVHQEKPMGVALWEWGVLLCASVALGLTAWRFPGLWDDTSYHLPLARAIVEHQALVANEWLRFPYFPAFMQLLFAAGLLMDASLAQWLANWPVVVTLIGLMGAAQWFGSHSLWGVAAWLLYVTTPSVKETLGFAYVDVGLALFCTAALLAAVVWSKVKHEARKKWLLMAGLCSGIAGGIKILGLVFATAVGVGILSASWTMGSLVRSVWIYGGSCAAVCAFWYVRSYWVTGDPVHPAGGRIFGYYLWTAQDLVAQAAEQATHGVPKKWIYFPKSLVQAKAFYLWGVLAFPLMRGRGRGRGRGRNNPFFLIWLVASLMIFFWFWVSQVERYLMPILPLGALMAMLLANYVGAWLIRQLQGPHRHVFPAAVAFSLVLAYAWQAGNALMERPSGAAQREARDEVVLLQRATELQSQFGTKVLNFGYENAFFYYQGQLIGDWFGPASFFKSSDCVQACDLRSVEEVEQLMRKLDASMLLINSKTFRFNEYKYSERMDLIEKKGSGYLYALRSAQ